MIKELLLGNKIFPVNLIQGPLAGVSCAPFRRLAWQYSKPAFSCTEMISCKTILQQPSSVQYRYVAKDLQEGPVCFQLASSEPNELAEAVKRVTSYGADLIDLNCGCPVKKIRAKGAGSSLLQNGNKLYQMIKAMKANTHLPVSIKIRVEGSSQDKFHQEIARIITDAGADFLVVHGRHWTEHYETRCHFDQIQFFAAEMKIPVIGNGDVADITSLRKMFATGCAGIMIARAGVGQPWLISRLIAESQNKPFTVPTVQEVGAIFIEHVQLLTQLLSNEKIAILQARKLAKYYARCLKNSAEFCEAINACDNLAHLQQITYCYFR